MKATPKIFYLLIAVSLIACSSKVTYKDVSEESKYKHAIGIVYEVVGAVEGYGIRDHSGVMVEYITLIPPPGIGGTQVGFNVPVNLGAKITIVKVLRSNRWFDSKTSFVVKLDGAQMPSDVLIRIELFRGNEGDNPLELNPKIYQRFQHQSGL